MAGALIGALRVSLSAETTAFEAGMTRAQAAAKRTAANINTSFKGAGAGINFVKSALGGFIGALSVGSLIAASKAALEYAGSLGEAAQQIGVTSKDLQTLRFAGSQFGVSTEQMDKALQKFTKSLGDAKNGSAEAIKTFKSVGFTDQDIARLDAHEALLKTADGLSVVSDRAKRASPEVRLLGRAGQQLDPLLTQGSKGINELALAAEKLGIVLSDEQINNADRTADKITALSTALKANIASAVADNAQGIYTLVNALTALVSVVPKAIQGWQLFLRYGGAAFGAISRGFNPITAVENSAAARNNDLLGARFAGDRAAMLAANPVKGDFNNFLASPGSAKKDDLERKQLDALQKAYDFQKSDLDAQKDILGAKKDLSEDYIEQTTLSIQILNLERQQYQADLDNQVAQNRITKGKEGISQAQADHLLAQYDITDGLKRQKVLQDEEEQRQRDVGELEDHILDRQKDYLGKLADLATTQADRRKIQLEILELEYQEKKQVLDRIIANSKNAKEVEDARRDLFDLKKNHAADKQGVINSTRNPIEEWAASVPKSAAEINEALQSIEANGIQGLSEALTGVITGTESLKSAFHNLAASILADLIQMTIKMLLFKALTAAFGGAVGGTTSVPVAGARASGGPVLGGKAYLIGEKGPELFLPRANGSIVPNSRLRGVSGEMSRMPSINMPINIDATGADAAGLARVEAELQQLRSTLPGTIVATMSDARERFLWRGK